MIEVRNLFKRFGFFEALENVDFDVARGESVGLLGENGAGKTTTMRILSCFLPPSSGTVRVAGFDVVFASREVRRRIGYLPESVPIYPGMRVREFLRYRARLKGLRGRDAREAVERVIGQVHLATRARSLVGTLSKGLRQRVGLADALVHGPDLLILDEPTSGLDPTQRIEVRELIRSLGDRHTVLISSHILPEIESTCERVVVIHAGTVVARESIAALREAGGTDRFRIVVRATPEAVRSALAPLADLTVEELVQEGGGVAATLRGHDETDRARALRALLDAGMGVLELAPRGATLEDVFILLTRGDEAAS